MTTNPAFKTFVDLFRKGTVNDSDLHTAIKIVLLRPTRQNAMATASGEVFSGHRFGDEIDGLVRAVGFLAKALRDDGVDELGVVINEIRRAISVSAPYVESVLMDALQLAELVHKKSIPLDVLDSAIAISLESASPSLAQQAALQYVRVRGLSVDEDFFAEVIGRLKEVEIHLSLVSFNQLVAHMRQLVQKDWVVSHLQVGDTFYFSEEPSRWFVVFDNFPKDAAKAWVLAEAPRAQICGVTGVTARQSFDSAVNQYPWQNKLAVVVRKGSTKTTAIAFIDNTFVVYQKENGR